MSWSVTLFNVKGIAIKVHATFGLVLLWAAWSWSTNASDAVQGALFGVVATLLLFVAVTLHELAHSLQAIRYGVRVEDITLYPIGGVARMAEIPDKPQQELGIAIVGPLTNLALAALGWGVGALLDWRSVISLHDLYASLGDTNWSGLLAYLTLANLALGLFNLIPAFPMDGGRVLRALLAMRMDYARATGIAVAVGQGLALLLGFAGFASASPSLILIAVFIWMGAGQEGQQTKVKSTLRDTTVAQAMTPRPRTLSPDDSLARAADLLLSSDGTAFPVVEADGRLAGLLTEDGLLKGLRAHPETAPVRDAMSDDVPTTTPDEPLFVALQRMVEASARAMVVLDRNGALVGLLTIAGINEAQRLLAASPDVVRPVASSSGPRPAQPAVAS